MKSKTKIVMQRILLLTLIVTMLVPSVAFADDVPYTTYNYDYWENIVYTPAAYIPDGKIDGNTILDNEGNSIGAFKAPSDIFVASDGNLYIVDSGKNRIVILKQEDYSFVGIIDGFTNAEGQQDTFKAPEGICHSEDPNGYIYIADTGNYRIVILDSEYNLVNIIESPQREDNVLEDSFVFAPQKVIVDYAERLYVIAKNTEEGIMIFNTEHEFESFFGTITVSLTTWERVWRKLSTKAQRAKQTLNISTEYNGLDVDDNGFIYASYLDETGLQAVMRLNPKGKDVIKKGYNSNVGGDISIVETNSYSGKSQAKDVVYRGHGIYSFLDRKRGRIFTYDHEGNLLYIFGGLGSQEGCFKSPYAIEENVNGQIMVADGTQNVILLFKATEYGNLINEAVALRHDGDEALAVDLWKKVLEYDANFELAYIGLGKAYMSAGDNEKAMEYLELGMSRQYYSIAFRRYRNEFLVENLNWMLTVAAVVVIGGIAFKKFKDRNRFKDDEPDTMEV